MRLDDRIQHLRRMSASELDVLMSGMSEADPLYLEAQRRRNGIELDQPIDRGELDKDTVRHAEALARRVMKEQVARVKRGRKANKS